MAVCCLQYTAGRWNKWYSIYAAMYVAVLGVHSPFVGALPVHTPSPNYLDLCRNEQPTHLKGPQPLGVSFGFLEATTE